MQPTLPMKNLPRAFRRFATALAFLLTLVAASATDTPAPNLKPIFNGTNLAGWKAPDPNPFWRIEGGVLIGENDEKRSGHVLFTDKTYTNFVLELEVRWSDEVDSGVMLRKPELQVQFG